MAKVTPLFKSGKRDKFENYRPISILSTVSKIFEQEVHHQLLCHLEENNILHPCQHGFRAGKSTHTALLSVVDQWLEGMGNGKISAIVFLDLAKAFDIISHSVLLEKLYALGVKGKALEWFSTYLENCEQQTAYNGLLSQKQLISQ